MNTISASISASSNLNDQMDPNYTPEPVETRQVYGVYLQQRRNDAKIDAKLFGNIVTANKEVRL